MLKELKYINIFFIALLIGETLLFAMFGYVHYTNEKESAYKYAKVEAQASFNKDLIYRRWASMHGGVYAPITEKSPPNPYLSHIKERDIQTASGKKLTLINPAYMTRQVHTIGNDEYDAKGHITSLNPIRAENKAVGWEIEALMSFEKGSKEYVKYETVDNTEFLRFMQPMITEENCLKCHAQQGYKVGDIRGGISVSVPMDKYLSVQRSHIKTASIYFSSIYLLVLISSIIAYIKIYREVKEREKVQDKLIANEQSLNDQIEEYINLNEEYKHQNFELTKTRSKVEFNEIRFEAITEQSMDGIALIDLDGNFSFVNPAFCEITGYEEAEILSKNISDMTASGEKPKIINDIIEGRNAASKISRITKKDKSMIYVELNLRMLQLESNDVILIVMRDITERVKTEIELLQAKEKAEESDKLKSAFLANMSHEIRTPMNGILGFSQLLKEPNLSGEEQQAYISIIEKSGKRMLNTINDLINISKIESGQVDITKLDFNLNELMNDLYQFFKPEAEAKNNKFSLECQFQNDKAIINTDSEKLNVALSNIINNAIKFTDNGEVKFGYRLIDNNLQFFVSDNGIGIPEEKVSVIYDRFVQCDLALSSKYEGAGLGLSIAKAYIELLGGSISVESEVSQGTTFYFTVPYVNSQASPNNVEFSFPVDESLCDLTILIADDDAISSRFLEVFFKPKAKKIIKAKNGMEAIEQFNKNLDIDLIFMDLKMPMMDGSTAAKIIKESGRDVKIIAQSAYAMDHQIKEYRVIFDDYITKPILIDKLETIIKQYSHKTV